MFQRTLLAALACLLLPLAAQGQDAYTIKLKKSTKGSTTREQKVDTNVEHIKVSDTKDNVLDDKKTMTTLFSTYEQTILERPDLKKKPTALKRTYEKAVIKDAKGSRELPYQGKTVLIEKKDGKYRFTVENGADITGDAAKWLDKEFNGDKDKSDADFEQMMLPPKAVTQGESWKISIADIAQEFKKGGMKLDADKSVGTGKLLKAYEKDGRQFGDLEYKLDVAVKSVKEKDNDIVFQPGARIVLEAKMSVCIDGSAEDGRARFMWTFKGTALVPADNPTARVEIDFHSTVEGTVSELQKK